MATKGKKFQSVTEIRVIFPHFLLTRSSIPPLARVYRIIHRCAKRSEFRKFFILLRIHIGQLCVSGRVPIGESSGMASTH